MGAVAERIRILINTHKYHRHTHVYIYTYTFIHARTPQRALQELLLDGLDHLGPPAVVELLQQRGQLRVGLRVPLLLVGSWGWCMEGCVYAGGRVRGQGKGMVAPPSTNQSPPQQTTHKPRTVNSFTAFMTLSGEEPSAASEAMALPSSCTDWTFASVAAACGDLIVKVWMCVCVTSEPNVLLLIFIRPEFFLRPLPQPNQTTITHPPRRPRRPSGGSPARPASSAWAGRARRRPPPPAGRRRCWGGGMYVVIRSVSSTLLGQR